MILLDTNTIIYFLKGHPGVVARILSADRHDLAIAAISSYELEVGTLRSHGGKRRDLLAKGLQGIEQVPFDISAARHAAQVRVDLQARGLGIGPLDTLIAGTALSRGAVLVTNNVREFSRVSNLTLEDWVT